MVRGAGPGAASHGGESGWQAAQLSPAASRPRSWQNLLSPAAARAQPGLPQQRRGGGDLGRGRGAPGRILVVSPRFPPRLPAAPEEARAASGESVTFALRAAKRGRALARCPPPPPTKSAQNSAPGPSYRSAFHAWVAARETTCRHPPSAPNPGPARSGRVPASPWPRWRSAPGARDALWSQRPRVQSGAPPGRGGAGSRRKVGFWRREVTAPLRAPSPRAPGRLSRKVVGDPETRIVFCPSSRNQDRGPSGV